MIDFCFLNAASAAIAKKLKFQVIFSIACCRLFVRLSLLRGRDGGAVGESVRPASGRLGVRIPAATDPSHKTGSDSSTTKRSALGASVTGPQRPL